MITKDETFQSRQEEITSQLKQSAVDSFESGMESVRKYVRQNPESAALWCLGIGFVLGWKLKPW